MFYSDWSEGVDECFVTAALTAVLDAIQITVNYINALILVSYHFFCDNLHRKL